MNWPTLKFGGKEARIPIIQGGMGIGVSGPCLAGAVANAGGIGIISGAQIGYQEADFRTCTKEANRRGLHKAVEKARKISPQGIIGINFLTAMTHYNEMVQEAVKAKVDLIISGAGLPLDLPQWVKDTQTSLMPIVSSLKAAKVILKKWDRDFDYTPDGIIVEGHRAGGHLGFDYEALLNPPADYFEQMVKGLKELTGAYEIKYKKKIQLILAGGFYGGRELKQALEWGADGVQMASRFVATEECDAHPLFKEAYIKAKEADITLIKSPVGMPGRALMNDFVQRTLKGPVPVNRCYHCLKTCQPNTTPYCITEALIRAVQGDVKEGLIFAGAEVHRIEKISPVDKLIEEILREAEA